MWQNNRSHQPEILDLGPGHYTQSEYAVCLKRLISINKLLGGYRAVLNSLKGRPFDSILEIGAGGGGLSYRLGSAFPKARILGIDINNEAVRYAEEHLPGSLKNVAFMVQKDKQLDFPDRSFDVVTAMLVTHHMEDEELVAFLKESYRICRSLVVINDLQRHVLAYLSFSLLAPILFPSRLIWHDGRLSIRRSFRKGEWLALLKSAGFQKDQFSLRWCFPFRWTLTLFR